QRNIVLLTDGGDTTSKATLATAINSARRAGETIFSVGLKTSETDVASLRQMSSATHGRYTAAASGELISVYQQILTVLTSQFRITFGSHARRGATSTLTVAALGGSASFELKAPPPFAPSPKPSRTQVQPLPPSKPLLSGTWGVLIVLGLTFLAIYALALILLLPGVRMRRERDIARRVGMPPPADAGVRSRDDRTPAAYRPTLGTGRDRPPDAGGVALALRPRL